MVAPSGISVPFKLEKTRFSLAWDLRYLLIFVVSIFLELVPAVFVANYMILDFFAESHGGGDCDNNPSSEHCLQAASDYTIYSSIVGGLVSCISWMFSLGLGQLSDVIGRRVLFQIRAWLRFFPIVALCANMYFGASLWLYLATRPVALAFDTTAVFLACSNDIITDPQDRALGTALVFVVAATSAAPLILMGALCSKYLLIPLSFGGGVAQLVMLHTIFPETLKAKAAHEGFLGCMKAPSNLMKLFTRHSFIFRCFLLFVFGSLSQTSFANIFFGYLTGYMGFVRSDLLKLSLASVASALLWNACALKPLMARFGQVWILRWGLVVSAMLPLCMILCRSKFDVIVMHAMIMGPMSLYWPVMSAVKANLVAEDEQGLVQGGLSAIVNLSSGISGMFFGWLYVYVTEAGVIKDRSVVYPIYYLSTVLGAISVGISFSLPLDLPPPPPPGWFKSEASKLLLPKADLFSA